MPTHPPPRDAPDCACLKLQPVKPLHFLRLLGLLAALTASAYATEYNISPFWNGQTVGETPSPIQEWTALGPLFFHQASGATADPGQTSGGFRPLYVWKTDPTQGKLDSYFLYPLFSYRSSPTGYNWSLF